jgi:hypothetical protein
MKQHSVPHATMTSRPSPARTSKYERGGAKGRELGVCTAASYSTRARRSWLRGLTIVLRSVVEALVAFVA